ncbi:hypothetical protein V1515DRAFT_45261 [Lipomyces mesembrius]
MAHKHSSSSASMASERDVDEGDFLVPAESIESTNEVQTATAASLIGTRPTQVLVNPRRVSGTPSISSTVSGSTVTPATVGARGKDVMPPPATAPRTVYAAPVAEYNSDLEIGPPSPTASTTSFFTSASGADHSANETDTYVDAVDDGHSSRASTETIPAAVVPSAAAAAAAAAAAPEAALETFESTRPAMTASDVSANCTAVPESDGSTMSEKAGLVGAAVEVDSAPVAAAAIGKGTTKATSGLTNGAANTGKVPVAISEKAVTSKKKSNKWKWVIIIAMIVAIAIGVGVGVGVGVGTRKHQNSNNGTAAGGASSSAVSPTTGTSSLIGAGSSSISAGSSVVSGSPSFTSAANSGATSAAASTSRSSSATLSSFSTVTTTQSSASRSLSSPSRTSSVSSDASATAPSSANPSLSVFRSVHTTTFRTSVVATRTYLDFPFRTTVEATTTAVRTATYTLTLSK